MHMRRLNGRLTLGRQQIADCPTIQCASREDIGIHRRVQILDGDIRAKMVPRMCRDHEVHTTCGLITGIDGRTDGLIVDVNACGQQTVGDGVVEQLQVRHEVVIVEAPAEFFLDGILRLWIVRIADITTRLRIINLTKRSRVRHAEVAFGIHIDQIVLINPIADANLRQRHNLVLLAARR